MRAIKNNYNGTGEIPLKSRAINKISNGLLKIDLNQLRFHGSGFELSLKELSRRNWSEKKIAKELGMEADEVLRLKQITGLAEMFSNKEFSESWEID